MGESLTTENAYLSVSSFPVVVLTECGLLSDLERTTIMEQLEDLIDGSERHALVIDLTEGAALPDKQRIYVAEAIQMRSKAIVEKWAALAIVVGGPEHQRLAKAEFWLGISPVPGRVFSAIEPAMAWAQECVAPEGEQGLQPGLPAPEPTPRVSRGSAVPRPAERITRSNKIPASANAGSGPITPANGNKKASAPKSVFAKLGRKGLAAVAVVLTALLILLLGPSANGRLSGAEARAFEQLKRDVSLKVYRDGPKGGESLERGATCAPGDKLGFAVSIPAKGHIMILGVRANASTFAVFPGPSSASVSKTDLGARLPMSYSLDETTGKLSLHLVYCPMPFEATACTASNGGRLECPSDCVSSEFGLSSQS